MIWEHWALVTVVWALSSCVGMMIGGFVRKSKGDL